MSDDKTVDVLDEIAKLLALQIRLACDTQNQAIIELGRVGFAPARIGELLGTTAATARVTLNRDKKAGAK